jgi:hypothetical protein
MDPATEKRIYGMRALSPALALADLYTDPDTWHPDPDDLDIPDQDHGAVLSAFELLGVGPKVMRTALNSRGSNGEVSLYESATKRMIAP